MHVNGMPVPDHPLTVLLNADLGGYVSYYGPALYSASTLFIYFQHHPRKRDFQVVRIHTNRTQMGHSEGTINITDRYYIEMTCGKYSPQQTSNQKPEKQVKLRLV